MSMQWGIPYPPELLALRPALVHTPHVPPTHSSSTEPLCLCVDACRKTFEYDAVRRWISQHGKGRLWLHVQSAASLGHVAGTLFVAPGAAHTLGRRRRVRSGSGCNMSVCVPCISMVLRLMLP